MKFAHFDLAWHLVHHLRLFPAVASHVREDDAEFYRAFAQRHSDEALPNLWKTLKPLLPRASAKRRNNLRCVGPATQDIVQHFDQLEAGEAVPYPGLLQQCHPAQQKALAEAPLEIPLSDLPSRLDLERMCCCMGRHQALIRSLQRLFVLAFYLHQMLSISSSSRFSWKEPIHCNGKEGNCM